MAKILKFPVFFTTDNKKIRKKRKNKGSNNMNTARQLSDLLDFQQKLMKFMKEEAEGKKKEEKKEDKKENWFTRKYTFMEAVAIALVSQLPLAWLELKMFYIVKALWDGLH